MKVAIFGGSSMAFILFDEHLGQCYPAGEVQLPNAKATVRDIIRARVELELERDEDRRKTELETKRAALVRPGEVETALNGDRGAYGLGSLFLSYPKSKRANVDAFVRQAEAAFESGRYFLLLNDRQAESLDEEIDLGRTSEATFLLITPLQGG